MVFKPSDYIVDCSTSEHYIGGNVDWFDDGWNPCDGFEQLYFNWDNRFRSGRYYHLRFGKCSRSGIGFRPSKKDAAALRGPEPSQSAPAVKFTRQGKMVSQGNVPIGRARPGIYGSAGAIILGAIIPAEAQSQRVVSHAVRPRHTRAHRGFARCLSATGRPIKL